MRKGGLIALALLLIASVASLAVVGCGGPGEEPDGEGKVYTLKYAQPAAIRESYFGLPAEENAVNLWKKAVETVTDGQIQIDLYPGESLHKGVAAFESCSTGVSDIAFAIATYSPEWLPMEDVWYLPAMNDLAEQNGVIYKELYDDHFKDDYHDRGLINVACAGGAPYVVWSVSEPIRTIEDFEGLTMRASGKAQEVVISPLGVLPVDVAWTDAYEALQKGIIDTSSLSLSVLIDQRWYETGDPGYVIDVGGIGLYHVIYLGNKGVFDQIPDDLLEKFFKVSDYWLNYYGGQRLGASDLLLLEELDDLGIEYIEWSQEQKQEFREEYRDPVYDWWIDRMEDRHGRGDDAAELLDAYREKLENFEYGARAPMHPIYLDEPYYSILTEAGYLVSQEAWDHVTGPDGTWGMDYDYYEGFEGDYEWEIMGLASEE